MAGLDHEVSRIRVEITPDSLGTRVWIDEQQVKGLLAVVVRAAFDEPSSVTLVFEDVALDVVGSVRRVRSSGSPPDAQGRAGAARSHGGRGRT